MYAIIKNNQIIWFTNEKITQKNMSFDKLVEWDFDNSKKYILKNWKIIEDIEYIETLKIQKINDIKQKYSSIIFAKYSLTDQLNMSNEALMINTSANIEQRAFTEKELARFQEIKQAKVWIDEQRELCKQEIEIL